MALCRTQSRLPLPLASLECESPGIPNPGEEHTVLPLTSLFPDHATTNKQRVGVKKPFAHKTTTAL